MKASLLLLIALVSFNINASAQKKGNTIELAFYNLENLFDTIDDPYKNDNEFLPDSKKVWNTEKYKKKINNMSKVINCMGDNGPEFIGFCELENATVLEDLLQKSCLQSHNYKFVHFDSPDERSIDVAFAWKDKHLKFISAKAYIIKNPDYPQAKTRDILLVSGQHKKDTLYFIINHFPSRLGDSTESAQKRMYVASINRKITDSIQTLNPAARIMIMGDFNDEPSDPSIKEIINANNDSTTLTGTSLFNAMLSLQLSGQGSYNYKKQWDMLDQIILSRTFLDPKGSLYYVPGSATIFSPEWLKETNEKFKGNPFRTYAGNNYLGGYSDHFGVYVRLREYK